jgi:hypothetical protein
MSQKLQAVQKLYLCNRKMKQNCHLRFEFVLAMNVQIIALCNEISFMVQVGQTNYYRMV